MFPLASPDFPTSATALAQALDQGLQGVLVPPAGRELVRLEAPRFPEADHLTVDLTGCRVIEEAAVPPQGLHGERPALSVERLLVTATPLFIRTATVRLELTASSVRLDYARDNRGRLYLVPSTAQTEPGGGEGNVRVELGRSDLESLLLAVVQPIAEANGLGVEEPAVELRAEGPRSVLLHAAATGKKLFVKARVHVYGRLEVDDSLTATVDQLRCEGDGFIGEMAEKMIQPRLSRFNGMRLPLAGFSLGGLRLHDLKIATPDGIEVTARLGG